MSHFKSWIKKFNGIDHPIGDLAEFLCYISHMTFKDWIRSFYLIQHPFGYLAWDISTDENFPKITPDDKDLQKALEYLKRRTNDDPEILSYFKMAFSIFVFDSLIEALHN